MKKSKLAVTILAAMLALSACSGGDKTGGKAGQEAEKEAGKDGEGTEDSEGVDKGDDARDSQEDSEDSQEENGGDSQAEADQKDGGAEALPEYTPVDFASIPENQEGDFIFTDNGAGRVEITGYTGTASQVKIPANLGGAERIAIGKDAFVKNEEITCVYLPDTVVQIAKYSFYNCKGLEEVYIGNGVLEIPESSFRGCESLRKVVIGESCSQIRGGLDSGAFQDCHSLTEVTFPASLKQIEMDAFMNCDHLPQVDLSHTQLTMIGQQAFTGCLALERISLPPTLLAGKMGMESNAFLGCKSLASMEFPGGNDNFEVVDGLVYNGDTLLLKLGGYPNSNPVIREGTTSIDGNAFEYDEIITSVQIPDSVTNIGRLAFANCPNLEQVDLGNGVTTIEEYAFQYCTSLKEIDLPASVTKLEGGVFAWCGSNLTRVSLPDQVTYSSGQTTEDYMFNGDQQVVITYKGQEYTYDQAAQLDAALGL